MAIASGVAEAASEPEPISTSAINIETTKEVDVSEIAKRDHLIAAQESLLNTYRCLFSIDVQLVASGCNEGQPADSPVQPTVFHGPPTESEVIKRDHLIAAQESLLNTYRCLFSIDVQL
ncbi:MAG: hypothetical protein F4138_02945, partial [Acidimicrobiia bacterium]|nr:hypothetical protein [Acidimicrobiia bacterium]